jgi:hypothetical protein
MFQIAFVICVAMLVVSTTGLLWVIDMYRLAIQRGDPFYAERLFVPTPGLLSRRRLPVRFDVLIHESPPVHLASPVRLIKRWYIAYWLCASGVFVFGAGWIILGR